ADLRLPPRLTDWSDHHILLAMSRRGEDLPGNFVIGEESFARWQVLEPVSRSRDDYPALAEATIAGHPPGSSAGGERPKFGALVGNQHMLVKFAGRGGIGAMPAGRGAVGRPQGGLGLQGVGDGAIRAAAQTAVESPVRGFRVPERL